MCFSAPASFSAAAVLSVLGYLSWKKARPDQRYFAAIPSFFALQQMAEGIVWVALGNGLESSLVLQVAKYIFLFFAFIFWPAWMPFSLYMLDASVRSNRIVQASIALGGAWAAAAIYYLLKNSIDVGILQHHIYYDAPPIIPNFFIPSAFVYLGIVIAPLLVSRIHNIRLFAVLLVGAHIASLYYWECCFTSTWCFWAALLSGLIVQILRKENEKGL